ncbi:MAG: GDP-mannose 4,6-dehydratase [archaeon]|nr:GDP-mannose 4,6-dehydratase [archaeon]MCP8315153.1 GDP-mannose 4,6-dehydratase [archaeon]MCP8316166.1 GDP-mannose 4,6-dehydratase [archaeon]
MKILITGGAGFIGSHIAEYYAKKGEDVLVFDNLSRNEILGKSVIDPLYNWRFLKNNYSNVKLVKGDVRNFEDLNNIAEGSDVIIHTAAQVAVTKSLTDPRTDFEINTLGTFNVLEAARLNDSTMVFTSTNKVYGENVNKIPVVEKKTRYEFASQKHRKGIPEEFPIDLTGHSPYGCSKLAADVYVQDYAHTYGLKTGIFRMSCIYAERQFGVEDQGWLSWFVIATLTNKPITIYGDGKQVRDVLYVSDLIEAFDSFLESRLKHEVLNMGGGPNNTLSLLELLELLEKLIGKRPKVNYSNWRPADQKVYISDISKAEKLLRWKPKVRPEDGVKRLVNWVSKNITLFN